MSTIRDWQKLRRPHHFDVHEMKDAVEASMVGFSESGKNFIVLGISELPLLIYLPLIIKASRACSHDYEMEDADAESMVDCVEFGERIFIVIGDVSSLLLSFSISNTS
ncbi:hypothetical protein DKX38_017640 [Salix brachista]|uniref:Uncharacterized protein n=1 Tax=Salix brachista TaxID=2182728 RepID=A0A5N5KVU1_9ROSI|nr:hypothetical protein DKX38_017640 [Salix brachista]